MVKKNKYIIEKIKGKDPYKGERIGQWVWNAMAYSGYWESPEANILFFISDEDFIKALNKYVNKQKN